MFEESLVESTPLLRAHSRWPAVFSITLQAAVALAIIAFPMLHPELLTLHAPLIALLAPPRPVPPPPPVRVHIIEYAPGITAPSIPQPVASVLPRFVRDAVSATEDGPAPNLNPTSIMSGEPSAIFSAGPAATGARITVTHPAANVRPRLSTGISTGLLLTPLHPVYPRIAVMAHQEGTVVVQAIISRTGQIESAHVISGPVMLQQAALDSVREARYRPFLLNNEPTEVDTTFSINFHLGSEQ